MDVTAGVSGWLFEPVMTTAQREAREREHQEQLCFIESRSCPPSQWCQCENCTQMDDALDNVCCQEDDTVRPWVEAEEGCKCIIKHSGFVTTILNIHVLNMIRHDLLRFTKDVDKRALLRSHTNKTHRYLAYRNFVSWINSGEKLGKHNRVRIPSCVVNEIRLKWPDIEGQYVGFRQAMLGIDFE
jgi:hypothetical protein